MRMHLKRAVSLLVSGIMSACMVIPAFAGWSKIDYGYTWVNEDGSSPTSTWQWIDGNGDGKATCFYFNENRTVVFNDKTPDGYEVDEAGRWIIDGQVQQKEIGAATQELPYEGIYYYLFADYTSLTSTLVKNSKIEITKNADGTYHVIATNSGEVWLDADMSIFSDIIYGSELRSAKDEYGNYNKLLFKWNTATEKYEIINVYGDGMDYFVKE